MSYRWQLVAAPLADGCPYTEKEQPETVKEIIYARSEKNLALATRRRKRFALVVI